ncbi:unnamed protein product [Allacma fusca]|uniref:Trafficking protein particle complex subunit n=1 Tax=Allacma fusca TaxID=39272 RepID=A0A8J2PPV0_9HEXA|nr:unnamed protein product [Allacma fusca]
MAVCVAVIGKDNGPMYFRTRQSGVEELQYHFIVSSALDIIEERVQSSGKSGILPGGVSNPGALEITRELYLGALTAQEEYKVYGYMTNTKIKFVIVIEESSTPLRENDIRTMFRKLHGAFCDLMSNPFYSPGSEIRSKRFHDVVNSIVAGQ